MTVRPAAVAGMFYPGRADVLREAVDSLLAAVQQPAPRPKAVIAPHAGYVYSGSTAALAYAAVAHGAHPDPTPAAAPDAGRTPTTDTTITRVVLLGPCHYVGIRGLALPGADALATPLGDVPVWRAGAALVEQFNQVATRPDVHAREHSLEVHLPFLQRALPDGFEVLPLAVGQTKPQEVAEVIDAVWGGPETLIVASSDLSHYHPYDTAKRLDAATIAQILAGTTPLVGEQACGAYPVNGLVAAAPAHGATPQLLGACNSGDTAGDHKRVVGYASFAFYG
jgi:AmmeMemoRadiSam system protein B